ncbi:hypothetical protein [Bythopirellula goksoeyrii]|uniref:Uncharacterized protein n=1 Tax=Bythopirellula goksoeyrii TaxID=1400387 RepID=A0A5B9QBV8_9BACT|nr:hypothetical protein [Bythopirellula goksoeyrii]QEG35269.1 hypothetical protein Pr1d_25640 [Bythopirellula goksoeyrii]
MADKSQYFEGVIHADAVYTLEEVKKRMRLGAAALRTARRHGLKVHRVGSRNYIIGKEFIDYISQTEIVS